jgi:hypothetical protein
MQSLQKNCSSYDLKITKTDNKGRGSKIDDNFFVNFGQSVFAKNRNSGLQVRIGSV